MAYGGILTKRIATYSSYNIETYYLFNRWKVWTKIVITRLERPKEWTEKMKQVLLEDLNGHI